MDPDPTTITLLSYTIAVVLVTTGLVVWQWRPQNDVKTTIYADVPFLTLHHPDWSAIGKALNTYERELDSCLEGLSYSLEVCLQSEAALGLEDGVLSCSLRNKIATISDLADWNCEVLRGLLGEFPSRLMLPETGFQEAMNEIVSARKSSRSTAQQSDPPPRSRNSTQPPSSSYDSVGQVVAHMVRDWTREGELVRRSVYDWCRRQVRSGTKTILIPGAGLGRLAWDLAKAGHFVEANEVSLTMAGAAHQLFQREGDFTLYPFLTDLFINEVDSELRYQSVRVQPPATKAMKGHLSYTIGDFVQLYGSPQACRYNVVITCFFLDTATNVLTYLAILSNLLPKGGQWIHVGPLQWHMNAQLHPSVDDLKRLVTSFGFRIDHWSIDTKPVDYRIEDPTTVRFTKYEGYQPLRMVATKVKDEERRFRIPNSTVEPVQGPLAPRPPPTSTVSIEELS